MLAFPRLSRPVIVLAVLATGMLFGSGRATHAQEQITINVGDFYFCDRSFENGVCETDVNVGDTVVWHFSALNLHTTTECGASCASPTNSPLWNSNPMSSGTFSQTFNTVGPYLYYCTFHPDQMHGRIVVRTAGAAATPTTVSRTPGAPTPAGSAPTGSGPLPHTGQGAGSDSGSSFPWLLVIGALAIGGGLLGLLGAAAYRQSHQRD